MENNFTIESERKLLWWVKKREEAKKSLSRMYAEYKAYKESTEARLKRLDRYSEQVISFIFTNNIGKRGDNPKVRHLYGTTYLREREAKARIVDGVTDNEFVIACLEKWDFDLPNGFDERWVIMQLKTDVLGLQEVSQQGVASFYAFLNILLREKRFRPEYDNEKPCVSLSFTKEGMKLALSLESNIDDETGDTVLSAKYAPSELVEIIPAGYTIVTLPSKEYREVEAIAPIDDTELTEDDE